MIATARPGFLAAYNAGPARYEDHLATGRPLPAETRAYVAVLAPADRRRLGRRCDGCRRRRRAPGRERRCSRRGRRTARRTLNHRPPSSRNSRRSARTVGRIGPALAPQSDGLFVSDVGRGIRSHERDRASSRSGGPWRGFGVSDWGCGGTRPTDGKIKAPTFGRAHVVGWVEIIRHFEQHGPAGACAEISNEFQCPERRRPPFARRSAP